jgi:hypothetical protein
MNTARLLIAAAAWALFCAPAAALAQDTVAQAQELYEAASYAEALTRLGTDDSAQGREYRALCLLALGREQDADRELEQLYRAVPGYVPAGERPPRFSTLARTVRTRVMPAVIRDRFVQARTDYQAKRSSATADRFVEVVKLIDASEARQTPAMVELRLLAEEYIELLAITRAPQPAALPAAAGKTAAATPGKPAEAAATPTVIQALPIHQAVPPVPLTITLDEPLTGALWVRIGADGQIEQAAIERSFHPRYDPLILAAARRWLYKPAVRDGVPIQSERVVNLSVSLR